MRGPSFGLALATLFALPLPAASQEPEEGRLSIHGYLTQGYAVSDVTPFYGMFDQASTDFRYAALQFRCDRKENGFRVQVNHRRLGKSAIAGFESALNVNSAFYERRTEQGLALCVGRVPVPRGIHNERRSIGVVLPSYRAPVIFYDEGAYFSETIHGLVLSKTFWSDRTRTLDAHLHGGGWYLLAYDQTGSEYVVNRIRAENAIGTQLRLNTPIEGLRFGASAQTYRRESLTDGSIQQVQEYQASVDATFSRFMVRAETELMDFETDDYYASYLQTGINEELHPCRRT